MSNDTVNVQRGIVGAGSDDDTYVLSANLIDANAEITISDVEGANKIQLIGGLTITSSIVAGDTAQLTLSNGAVVTVLGASTMSYEVGGNPLTGTAGVTKDYATFATDVLGTTVPTEGTSTGGESVVNEDGTATGGAGNAYTLTAAAESVDEGATATFNLTTDGTVAEGTVVNYTITGVDAADVDGGSLTGTATIAADGTATISVALLADLTTEGAETLTVTLDGTSVSASSTVNDTSETPTSKTFTLTTGTDSGADFLGTDADDTYTAALLTLNSTDSLDGGAGTDTLTAEINADIAATTTIANIENLTVTAFGAKTVNMDKITGVTTFTNKNSTGAVTVKSITDATMALALEGSSVNSIIADYAAGALSGTADNATIKLNGAKSTSIDVDSGFESMSIEVTADSDIDTLTNPGITTVTVTGSGNLDFANTTMDGVATLSAASYTGVMTTGTVSSTTGYVDADIVGSTSGASILLGSGADSIGFTGAETSASSSNTVKLGAGNDQLVVNAAGAGATYVFGEAGDDKVNVITTAITATDVIDLGEGTDTLQLANNLTNNAMILRGVENVVLQGTGGTQTFTNDDSATAINLQAANNDILNVANLYAGSTVAVNELVSGTASTISVDDIILGFASTEAATTVDVNVGAVGDITASKVTALTLDFAEAVTLAGAEDVTIDDTTSLTISAAKAVDLGTGISSAATDKLDSITATTTSGALDLGTIANSDKLQTLTATSAAGLTITDGTADAIDAAALLDTVTLSSGSAMALGTFGNGTAIADLTNFTATATTGDIVFTSGTDGDDGINATALGTVSLTATAGSIQIADGTTNGNLVTAADTTGITVNLNAKTNIGGVTLGTHSAAITNTKGDITSTLSGAAAGRVDFVAGTINDSTQSGSVNLTASSLTGGLITSVTNNELVGVGSSTITLGAANSSTVNQVTLLGYTASTTVTGSSGQDTIVNSAGGDALATDSTNSSDTYSGGAGTDTLSYAGNTHGDASGTNGAGKTTDGYAMNFSSSTVTFDISSVANATNITTLASGKVAQYDSTAVSSTSTTAGSIVAGGEMDTVSGFEAVIGSAQNDYIISANTGMTITGGGGNDKLTLGAGSDIVVTTVGAAYAAGNIDTISSFTAGSTNADTIQIDISDAEAVASVTMLTDGAGTQVAADTASKIKEVALNTGGTDLNGDADVLAAADTVLVLTGNTNGTATLANILGDNTDNSLSWAGAATANDAITVVYSDGTNAYVALVADAGTDAEMTAGELTVTNIATLSGVTTITSGQFVAGNFDFVA